MVRINFPGSRDDARRVINTVIGQLTGREPDQGGLARGVFLAIGFAALSDIQDDFIRKARGGTGEDGTAWAPLTKEYLAYQRRFGKTEKRDLKKAAGLGAANKLGIGGKDGLLTQPQVDSWWKHYRRFLAVYAARMPLKQAKSAAAATAWNKIKAEGAKTMLEVYGNRQVEILRDTGVLFNSLSPGYLDGSAGSTTYTPPNGEGGDQQIFSPLENGVIVGTNVPYARAHNEGYPKGGIPERRFIPKVVPDTWLNRWAAVAVNATEAAMRHAFLTGGAA